MISFAKFEMEEWDVYLSVYSYSKEVDCLTFPCSQCSGLQQSRYWKAGDHFIEEEDDVIILWCLITQGH